MNRTLIVSAALLLSAPLLHAAETTPKGKQLYESNCASCHGKKGEGRSPVFPPLFRSDYIMKKPQVLLHTLSKGINGPIKVNGKPYNGFMPSTALNPSDTAALATYIMTAFENGGGIITEKDVIQNRNKK